MDVTNWNLIKVFLAVAETGSLSAAATKLGQTQPTLSRQISQLELDSGCHLFKRTTQGLSLTAEGTALVQSAEAMDAAANQFQRQISNRSPQLSGPIKISTSEVIGTYLLPPAIAEFQRNWPEVTIDLVQTNAITSLSKGEADLALRMVKPEQPDLVARRLPDVELGFYAHRDYIDRYGQPLTPEELMQGHRLIGPDRDSYFLEVAKSLGYAIDRSAFHVRTDNLLMQIAFVRAGAGIGVLHKPLAQHWPDLVAVWADAPLPALPFWLVCHGDVQYNARVRALQNFLIDWFATAPYSQPLL